MRFLRYLIGQWRRRRDLLAEIEAEEDAGLDDDLTVSRRDLQVVPFFADAMRRWRERPPEQRFPQTGG